MRLLNKSARLHYIGGIAIIPGNVGTIDDALAARVKECPAVKAGELEIVADAAPVPAAGSDIANLVGMSLVKAKALIAAESSLPTLMAWAEADKRPEILAAIESRVKGL